MRHCLLPQDKRGYSEFTPGDMNTAHNTWSVIVSMRRYCHRLVYCGCGWSL